MSRPAAALAPAELRRALHAWYRAHHRRLPWRETRDPYAVWVSEIMLQQTRVDTVLKYYARFLERFPDIRALAGAPESAVLAAWSGLGYYRRARFLREAAGLLARDGGRFPETLVGAMALPGIGRSSAGSILSIAFDRPHPVLDGNVARVLQRLHAARAGAELGPRELWAAAEALLPKRKGALHTQAMMELGALVCLPAAPACPRCPVARWCGARARGLETRVPAPRKRASVVADEEWAAIAWRGGKLVLEERTGGGQLQGLAGLPLAGSREDLEWKLGSGARLAEELPGTTHAITTRRIRTHVWIARMSPRVALPAGFRAVPPAEVFEQPLDGTSRRLLFRELRGPEGRSRDPR